MILYFNKKCEFVTFFNQKDTYLLIFFAADIIAKPKKSVVLYCLKKYRNPIFTPNLLLIINRLSVKTKPCLCDFFYSQRGSQN